MADSYNDYETLQYVHSTVSNECKVIVVMDTLIPLVWSEVEPMADAILLWFNGYEGAVSVSYTHLDVYKRQVLESAAAAALDSLALA